MKLCLIAILLVLATSATQVHALTAGEVSTLQNLIETFPLPSSVISYDAYPLEGRYYGDSWAKPLDSVCDGVTGWDLHGIYCEAGRITKIKFTESWGQNISAIPDLSGLSAVRSFLAKPAKPVSKNGGQMEDE
jgi:hypothetical protein